MGVALAGSRKRPFVQSNISDDIEGYWRYRRALDGEESVEGESKGREGNVAVEAVEYLELYHSLPSRSGVVVCP